MKITHKIALSLIAAFAATAAYIVPKSTPSATQGTRIADATISLTPQEKEARHQAYREIANNDERAVEAISQRVRRKTAELDKEGITGDKRRLLLVQEIQEGRQNMDRVFQQSNRKMRSMRVENSAAR
jgi:hypothetical protein